MRLELWADGKRTVSMREIIYRYGPALEIEEKPITYNNKVIFICYYCGRIFYEQESLNEHTLECMNHYLKPN